MFGLKNRGTWPVSLPPAMGYAGGFKNAPRAAATAEGWVRARLSGRLLSDPGFLDGSSDPSWDFPRDCLPSA